MARPRPKRPSRKFGVEGSRVDFNDQILLDFVASRAARAGTSKYASLTTLLEAAGFTDAPAWQTWRQWENRRKIASAWLPTVLYSTLATGHKLTIKDLLKVHEA